MMTYLYNNPAKIKRSEIDTV